MWNSETDRDVELRAIVGALVLGADHPLTPAEIHRIVEDVEAARRAQAADAPDVTDAELVAAQAEEDVAAGRTTGAIPKAEAEAAIAAARAAREARDREAAATPAFRLPAKYVLHTVSPVWIDGRHREEEQLRRAYDAALRLADELGCRSVAFPLMAAGTYGFPHDLALSVAIRAFTDFLLEHEMQIDLVLFNARAFGIAGSVFDDLKSYIDDHYVAEKNEEEYRIDAAPSYRASNRRTNRPEAQRRRRIKAERDALEDFSAAPAAPQEEAVFSAVSLEELLKQHEKTFSEYLLDLLKERNGRDSEVYKRAEVSKQLFSKILSHPDYQPTKSTAIQLALGLQLDLAQTQKLLGRAGYALTRSSKADLVVQYYIERKIYNVTFINEALADCGLPLLKTGLKA